MKRTQSRKVFSRFLEAHVFAHHANDVRARLRDDNPQRPNLIHAGVSRIERARYRVETYFAFELFTEFTLESARVEQPNPRSAVPRAAATPSDSPLG